jgi:hypothetical protein
VAAEQTSTKALADRPAPDQAPVPAPSISVLPLQDKATVASRRREKVRERWVNSCDRRAALWLRVVPHYKLLGVQLETLEKRGKNNKQDVEMASKKIRVMESWPADACSGFFFDENSKPLAAIFADHIFQVSPDQLPSSVKDSFKI